MKTLKTNNFSGAILSNLESFYWEFKSRNVKTNGVINLRFNWQWNGFEGYGELDFSDGIVCNEFGNNYSNMTISSSSPKKNNSIKQNCALYNDSGLEFLFNYMLSRDI